MSISSPATSTRATDGIRTFDEMPSAVPNRVHRTELRADPFWLNLWGDGSQVSWESRRVAERRAAKGIGRITARDAKQTPKLAREAIIGRSQEARDALGALAMWRTATSEQLAAFGGWSVASMEPGHHHAARWIEHPVHLRLLWTAYLAERGRFNIRSREVPMVWRLTRDSAIDSVLRDLTFDQWLAVTAGHSVTAGPRHDRHNLLGTELGLRVAEFCEIAAVLGESMGAHHLLDVSGESPATTTASADLVALRTDGLRIVFETTATARQDRVERKVAQWLDVLSRTDFDESGTVVVFVDAGDPDGSDSEVFSPLMRGMEAALAQRPAAGRRRLRERVAIARWKDWFPAPDLISDSFTTLEVLRPTGRVSTTRAGLGSSDDEPVRGADGRIVRSKKSATASGLWEPAHLLDIFDVEFNPADPTPFTAAIGNASLLAGVPYWLRDTAASYGMVPDMDAWKFGGRPFEKSSPRWLGATG